MRKINGLTKTSFTDSEFRGGKIQPFCKNLKNIFAKKKTLACSASVCGLVFCCEDVERVVKNGRTYPVQRGPDRLFVKQRNQIVRRTYDLGRVVKLLFRKMSGH